MHAELQQGKQVDVYPSPLMPLWVSICRPTHTLGLCSNKVPCLMNTLDSYIVAKKPCRWRRRASIRFLSYSLRLHEQTWARGRGRAEEQSETEWQRGQDVTNICAMCQITARAVNWRPRCCVRWFFFVFFYLSYFNTGAEMQSDYSRQAAAYVHLKEIQEIWSVCTDRCADRLTDNLQKCFLGECTWHCLSNKDSQLPVSVPACLPASFSGVKLEASSWKHPFW